MCSIRAAGFYAIDATRWLIRAPGLAFCHHVVPPAMGTLVGHVFAVLLAVSEAQAATVVLETTVAAESEDIIQKGEFLSFPSLDLPLCEVSRLWERDNSDQEPAHTRTLQAIYHDAIGVEQRRAMERPGLTSDRIRLSRACAHIVDYASEAKYE
ncbi:hypothetical protein EVAR_27344_1 [Eumeta japonica]|uniref:Uncharacterized protein n=1 Tax=Eumeta variegata TaxID=151549 RepID=A0A4C1UDB2_EUMVA|nr:hypothetical protein EVAR_27344_1 [Eumeta japonica]